MSLAAEGVGPIAPDWVLFTAAGVGIALIIALITAAKVHPFIALIVGSAAVGLIAGLGPEGSLDAFGESFGGTFADVGILIALGAMLGKLLAESGGAERIVDTVIGKVSLAVVPWAMAGVSFLLGLPLFFEVGVVLIVPIALLAAKKRGVSPILFALPSLAALSLLNGFMVPHPGPLAAVSGLDASLGLALVLGIVVAIPTIVIGGPVFARFIAPRVIAHPPESLVPESSAEASGRKPSLGLTIATMLLPVVLMLIHAVAEIVSPESAFADATSVIGEPVVALLLGVLVAMFTLGLGSGMSLASIGASMGRGLPAVASVIVIVAAGGGFKGVLVASGVGTAVGNLADAIGIPILLLGWLITAIVRMAVGSGTVAIVTAVGLLAPLAAQQTTAEATLLVLAIGAGSRFGSHVNDAGFWLVKEYLGTDIKDTFKAWTVMDCLISVVALGGVLVLDLFI
ncbi:gluconate:H+ symporter [Galbitalea sp. SE-J8]|uniref:GntP family permease n=1 Tax=Galbitalea sp. SE-J8 TaxID=3054952 RepID=UPI00259D3069|nr:gluconate:H+ symporter [Galbitalea sp. SE-J8]MDM4762978.1 gluconate:H+ symporter [Galbitalea sp. SE-J8]